jgi:hypothetical protein
VTIPPNEPPLTQLGRALTEVDELKETLRGAEKTAARLVGVINTERATRFRFRFTMGVLVPLTLAILGVLVLNLVVLGQTKKAAKRAGDIAYTINDCLFPKGTVTAVGVIKGECFEEQAAKGIQGSVRIIRFQYCALSILPEGRTPAVMDVCVRKAFPDVDNIVTLVKEDQP